MADSNVGRLIYKITGDLSDIKASLSNAEKQINKFTKFVRSAAGLFGAAAAFKMLAGVVKDLWDAAIESDQAERKLAAAMKISGQASAEHTKQLTGLAKALSLVTTYTDEETIDAMTNLTEVGRVSAKGMRELIPLVQDMATGLGVDLNTASMAVAKAMAGSTAGLGKMGIKIKETSDPIERFNLIVQALGKNFGGMAEAMAKGAAGGLKQITMQFDELKEAAGMRLIQAFKGTISALSSRFKADVVLNMNVSDISSPEEATAFLKTLRVELTRVREAAKVTRLEQAGLGRSMEVSSAVVTDQDKRAADLTNKIEALTRFLRGWKEVEGDLSPVIADTTAALKLQDDQISKGIENATINQAKMDQDIMAGKQKSLEKSWEIDKQVEQGAQNAADSQFKIDRSIEEGHAASLDRQAEKEKEFHSTLATLRQDGFDFATGLTSALSSLNQANLDHDLAVLDNQEKERLANFKGTEEEKAAIEKEFDDKRKKLQFDAAMRNWQLQRATALVSVAEAILRGLESLPWPWNLIPAGMAGILGGVQLAAVEAAKPIPSFSEGGQFTVPPGFPNDSFLMRAQSGEEVNIKPAGAGGGERHYHLIVDGRELAHVTQKQLDNQQILVPRRSNKR